MKPINIPAACSRMVREYVDLGYVVTDTRMPGALAMAPKDNPILAATIYIKTEKPFIAVSFMSKRTTTL